MDFKAVNIFTAIIILILSGNLFSQEYLLRQFNYADSLYKNQQYFDAITEFKRLLLFDMEGEYKFQANEYIGMSYKEGAKFSDAILYFTLAEMSTENRNELLESKLQIIRCNILRRTTSHAIDLLNSLVKDTSLTNIKNEILYWKGWAFIFSDKWGKASEAFSQTDTNEILSDFCNKVDKGKYSVFFADFISHFIPGAGQFYTGHYLSGLLSVGWNVLWGYETIGAFAANRIFDGIIVGNFLWLRFYNGNLQNAKKFAQEENLKITNNALKFLQFNYNGLKP